MRTIAIMIGRGGSSMKNKNLAQVLGHPILHWGANAARQSKHVTDFYISSDSTDILNAGAMAGYIPILRSPKLATSTALGADVIRSVLNSLTGKVDFESDIVIVQHANCATVTTDLIDLCVSELKKDENVSAVIPAHSDQDHHPFRAKRLLPSGMIESFFPEMKEASSNRQQLPPVVFFDHSIWVVRAKHFFERDGEPPWKEMGPSVKVVLTQGSFDIHEEKDIAVTERWLIENGVEPPRFG